MNHSMIVCAYFCKNSKTIQGQDFGGNLGCFQKFDFGWKPGLFENHMPTKAQVWVES